MRKSGLISASNAAAQRLPRNLAPPGCPFPGSSLRRSSPGGFARREVPKEVPGEGKAAHEGAQIRQSLGHLEAALDGFRQALDLAPDYSEARAWILRARAEKDAREELRREQER